MSHIKLVKEQENDPELKDLCERALTLQEAEDVSVCFYKQNGVLMRKWRPPDAPANDEWQIVHQTVVPKLRHMKTHDRILNHFWWPIIRKLGRMFLSIVDLATLVK